MQLKTERLILRKFTAADFENFVSLVADPEVMRFSLSGPITSLDVAEKYFQNRVLDHYTQFGFGLYAVFHDGAFLGFVGLLNQEIEGERKVELGYRLLPQFWGRGFATEAAIAIRDYAFYTLGLDTIISIIEPANVRSLRVVNRVGMQFWKKSIFHRFKVEIYSISNRKTVS